jgi:hypothetical protein
MKLFTVTLFSLFSVAAHCQYISEVLEYKPAPGQFINKTPNGTPAAAQSIIGKTNGSLTLGSFGGYVVFRFEQAVENHPDNPFGIDFTIFGNASDMLAEQAIVYVMKDENNNGLADDTWYELAGSEYFFNSSQRNYSVTYTNPGGTKATNIPWIDSNDDQGFVLSNTFHTQNYYPQADSFPAIAPISYTLTGSSIKSPMDKTNSSMIKSLPKPFGYADNKSRGSAPFTTPDNPYTSAKENAGADGFDIDWAVNSTGEYVELDKIHFVKVQTAALDNAGWLGEFSTEITGAAVVKPNNSITGNLDILHINLLPDTIKQTGFQLEAFVFHKGRPQFNSAIQWTSSLQNVLIDDQGVIDFNTEGKVTFTATSEENPLLTKTVTTYLKPETVTALDAQFAEISFHPNPVQNYIRINSAHKNLTINIQDLTGKHLMLVQNYASETGINVENLSPGTYLISVTGDNISKTSRFVKQ